MFLRHKKIAFAVTNCIYFYDRIIEQIENIIEEGAEVIPVFSFNALSNEKIMIYRKYLEEITKNKITADNKSASKIKSDIVIVAPCSGNTIGKLAGAICDTPVLACVKENIKMGNKIVIGISTNDGLSTSAENIGKLLNRKNYFFVPLRQDNPITKPNSLRMDEKYIKETLKHALDGKQIQPLLL